MRPFTTMAAPAVLALMLAACGSSGHRASSGSATYTVTDGTSTVVVVRPNFSTHDNDRDNDGDKNDDDDERVLGYGRPAGIADYRSPEPVTIN